MLFFHCIRLTSVSIPNTINTIGEKAFCDCYNLTEILLPSSIMQIQDYAFCIDDPIFSDTFRDTSITCMAINPPVVGRNVFDHRNVLVIHVPSPSIEAYNTADGWSQYADVIVGI